MSESIHGHQVMEMMASSGLNYSKQTLKLDIAKKFGEHARFHTCHGSDLSADELIEFLSSKGKFIESGQGISLPKEHGC